MNTALRNVKCGRTESNVNAYAAVGRVPKCLPLMCLIRDCIKQERVSE